MFNVFIIGPMNLGLNRLAVIKDHITGILTAQGIANDSFRIDIPDELYGGHITENVFFEMDIADFVVADITGRSPNVFFEIALLYSLGTPMIFIDEKLGSNESIPFYLNQTNLLLVDSIHSDEARSGLSNFFKRFFDTEQPSDYTSSVISQYYGLPVIDISATTGVAFGYFQNFVRPFLKRSTGTLATFENGVSKLIIVRPDSLESIDNDKKVLKAHLGEYEGGHFKCPESPRKKQTFDYVKGPIVYDIPTALYTLKASPRYLKTRKRLNAFQNISDEYKSKLIARMTEDLIKRFFNVLEFLIRENSDDLNNAYEIRTIEMLK